MVLQLPCINEEELGYLIYFFEKACALSGYLLAVNPFNQPGVATRKICLLCWANRGMRTKNRRWKRS